MPSEKNLIALNKLKATERPGKESRNEHVIDIRPLKVLVAELPKGIPIKDLVLAENDFLTDSEFLAKMKCWLIMLRRA